MNYTLNDLLDIPRMIELLDSLHDFSNIPSAILDTEGNILIASAWQDICAKFHRVNPDTKKQCVDSDLRIKAGLIGEESYVSYKCPMGLMDAASPIVVEGKHLGNIYVGQLFLAPPDEDYFIVQARKYGFDETEYLESMRKVPVISEDQLRAKLIYIGNLTQLLAEQGLELKRQREAQVAQRESEEKFRLIFEQSMDAVFITIPDGSIVNANPTACRMFGRTEQELRTLGRSGVIDTTDPRFAVALAERERHGRVNAELTCIRSNGDRFPAEVSSVVNELNTRHSFVIVRDISERKQAEALLKKSEYFFKECQRAARIGSYHADFVNDIWTSSEVLDTIFGIDQLYDRSIQGWLDLVHPDDRDMMSQYLREEVITKRKPFSKEYRIVRKNDGESRWVNGLGEATFVRNGDMMSLSGTIQDVTERKLMEKALHDSEEQFRTLCDAAPIGIFMSDSEGNANYFNPRWQEITGMSALEGMGKGWVKGIHPDDIDEIGKIMLEATTNGRILPHEHRQSTPQGNTIWVRVLASPICGSDGSISSIVGTLEDITDFQQARQDMLKAVKLESLGVLAGGIAHDFNNILTAVFGNISLARIQLDDSEAVSKRLEDAENAIVRATDLTKQLLTFARGGEPIKKIIKVNDLLQDSVRFVLHGSNVNCEFNLCDDIWPVEADEGQLGQVIHNLILNAVQAMPQGGTVTIHSQNVNSLTKENRFVKITVADTGIGIPENILQKIFDPYFSTKTQGNGLGLATCYSIVKKHGGKIRVASTVGGGTTFVISLPASEHDYASSVKYQNNILHGSGRVLVMDDNEDVRNTAQGILKALGYTVELAVDGAEALAIYTQRKEQGTPIYAVILDLTIPAGMGGKETIENLLKIDPDVKAIVSSGYSNDPVMANYLEYGFRAVLSKPYRPQEMSKVLRDLLDL
jgi:PAS domain S-box-containing protein